jgi:Zn-dependent protease with chaperone function
MIAVGRAGISVLMLVGFYVVALLQLGAAIALAIWLSSVLTGVIALKITLPLFTATAGAVAVAIWKAIRAKPQPPKGLAVGPDQAPELWTTVHELADEAGTRVPDEIRLVPDVNAAVLEECRLLGLVGGRRLMYVGLPLLQVLTVGQLRSVLAHELGHYSQRHTQLGAVAYRGRVTIAETVSRIGPYNLAGWVFKAYGNLYLLVDNVVARRQEYEADQAAVRVAGRAAAASALRELPVLVTAWNFYFSRYVVPGWESGYAPADLFGGFAALVAARKEALDELRAEEPERDGSKWDTHPPIADRIAAIAAMPEARVPYDSRPSGTLVPNLADAGQRLQALMVDVGERTVLPWPQFTHATLTAQLQREADQAFRTIARQTGATELSLGTVFSLIAAGRLVEIAEPFFPNATRREAAPLFAEVLDPLMRLAAVRSGTAGWRHNWSGPAEFVTADGTPLSLEKIAEFAVSPGGLDRAYHWLREQGIDITQARLVERTASATGAGIIAALANVKVNQSEYDMLMLDQGFVFVANPGRSDKGKHRLQELVASSPAAELAQRHWFLPYEEITSATITKQVPARATIVLHGGQELALQETWGSELITKNSRDVLLEVLKSINEN